jgi:hypothetical protein
MTASRCLGQQRSQGYAGVAAYEAPEHRFARSRHFRQGRSARVPSAPLCSNVVAGGQAPTGRPKRDSRTLALSTTSDQHPMANAHPTFQAASGGAFQWLIAEHRR